LKVDAPGGFIVKVGSNDEKVNIISEFECCRNTGKLSFTILEIKKCAVVWCE